ncbi:MAG: sodium:solute symporter [Gemmataceae bacterium]
MQTMDYIVLVGYFVTMIVIGVICAYRIKKSDDYFMGGRSFGKLMQTFAAFGAGTGAQDPINVGRTTWTSGLSGIWSALMWLFVTPFYWILGVWYRRMRHTTLGDWFVERYDSKPLGVAYTGYALLFYMFYLSSMFSAISKVATPLLGDATVQWMVGLIGSENPADLKFVLVPFIALVVVGYGVVGGLTAAYWTDLIQGLCIILLSILLIPYGLGLLVDKFGTPSQGTLDGFNILHERVSPEYFQLSGGPSAGEFPLHYIVSLTLLGLIGIVVQPHFITVGGGTAKSEQSARVGLVTGNFLKRLCTIGWALTGLIVVALLADSIEINKDPEEAWGVASRDILSQVQIGGVSLGLVGLMLACLLAALMSSADCYMVVSSALMVRNVYAPYINPDASEKTYIAAGRVAGLLMIVGAVIVSLSLYAVFKQYTLALELPILFAASFWIGMYWRRATTAAAWGAMSFALVVFFLIPVATPVLVPSLMTDPRFTLTNDVVIRETRQVAKASDVARREAKISLWDDANKKLQDDKPAASDQAALKKWQAEVKKLGQRPAPLEIGKEFTFSHERGGIAIFWSKVNPLEGAELVTVSEEKEGDSTIIVKRWEGPLEGEGTFNVDYLFYDLAGVNLRDYDKAALATLRLPPRLLTPFLVVILISLLSRPCSQEVLDRYYVKMKTPVEQDPEEDARQLEESYANPERYDDKRLLPGTGLEVQKPSFADVVGFLISVGVCLLFLILAYWVANIGD